MSPNSGWRYGCLLVRAVILVTVCVLLFQPDVALAQDAAQTQAQDVGSVGESRKNIHIFNTVELRSKLKNMPKWQRVIAARPQSTFEADATRHMRGVLHRQWQKLVAESNGKSDLDKAKAVSVFFNRWPYRTDQEAYRVEDYWARPAEFMTKSGDCEDFAIVKFYALLSLGVAQENLRIVILKDTIRNLAHAVLVLYTEGGAYVLDNLTSLVLPHTRFPHYQPRFSINEAYRWTHIPAKKKKVE